jgi:putative transposase
MSEIYHVLSRGVDKRKIFMDDKDYFRFIHDMFEFNDEAPADTASYYFYKQSSVIARPKIERKPRKLLVKILAFCLMPNHYHLLLSAAAKDRVSKFMKKLNMGYSRYFNGRHARIGTLFEGRFKSVLVENQAHFVHLPYYIHLNPLDLAAPEWRRRKLDNYKKAIEFLDSYRWSSHLDYCGKSNFPSVTQRDFLLEIFGGEKGYQKAIKDWLRGLEIEKVRDIILE